MCGNHSRTVFVLILTVILSAGAIFAQTSSFSYQGRLADAGAPATGNYDLQFALFESVSGPGKIGQTQTISNVAVTAGVFTVTLDFGASAFPGASRWLEISARPVGAASFTVLTPRQQISSSPYAVRSLNSGTSDLATNAQQLAGVAANQYVQTGDARLSDSRSPTTGSANYIQNTLNQQAVANFNISGDGTAGGSLSGDTVNAVTQYNLGGKKALEFGNNNILKLGETDHVGIGLTFDTDYQLEVVSPDRNGLRVGTILPGGRALSVGGFGDVQVDAEGIPGGRLTVAENGNVGIGTPLPTAKLEVAGSLKLSGANGGITFRDGTTMTTAGNGGALSGTSVIAAVNDPTTAGTINDNRLSGNVARLSSNVFNGNQRVNGNATINDQSNSGLRVQTGLNGGTVASFGGLGDFQIDGPSSTAGRLAVKENGNVGIGTANPTSKLQVAGTVESTVGFKFPDGTIQTSALNPAIGKVWTSNPSVAPEVEIQNSGFITFLNTLTLPPGVYLIETTVQFENRANGFLQDNTRVVRCKLVNELLWQNRLGAPGSANDQLTMTLHTVLTQNTLGQVSLACGNLESNGQVFAKARRMTALRVADNPQ